MLHYIFNIVRSLDEEQQNCPYLVLILCALSVLYWICIFKRFWVMTFFISIVGDRRSSNLAASVPQPQKQNCITHVLSEEVSLVAFRVKTVIAGVRMAILDSKTWNQADASQSKSCAAGYSGNPISQMDRRGKREVLWYLRICFKNQTNQTTRRESTFISTRWCMSAEEYNIRKVLVEGMFDMLAVSCQKPRVMERGFLSAAIRVQSP